MAIASTVSELEADVSGAVSFGEEEVRISSTLYLPEGELRAVLVCWPGGSYDRRYWTFDSFPGYSFAEYAASQGFAVVAADHLGVGDSSQPEDYEAVDFRSMAAAADAFVGQLRERFPGQRLVGIGHSMGGAVTIVTQAEHGSYDRIGNLGMTHGAKGSVTGGVGSGKSARDAALEQAPTFVEDWNVPYPVGLRRPNHAWLYGPYTPDEVKAADDETAAGWPRGAYVDALTEGYSAEFAAKVECPVFLCFGDHDIPQEPRDDVSFYKSSNDITLLVLEEAAHCHNFAGSRTVLWDRLGAWSVED
jgi:pimeloyl-ACP methyl ester carboxylesterase